jgi:FixJ family two-component response regulator
MGGRQIVAADLAVPHEQRSTWPAASKRRIGLTVFKARNTQIADRLVISEKTVASHVGRIFNKDLSSRAAATLTPTSTT